LDGAAEWFSKDLTDFFKDEGILTEVSTPYTAHQNGIAEKANHLVEERVRVMLIETQLPLKLWPEVAKAAVHGLNMLPTSVNKDKAPPAQAMALALGDTDSTITYANWKIYGCPAYVLINEKDPQRQQGNKFIARAQKGRLVGYKGSHIYRVYIPHKNRVI